MLAWIGALALLSAGVTDLTEKQVSMAKRRSKLSLPEYLQPELKRAWDLWTKWASPEQQVELDRRLTEGTADTVLPPGWIITPYWLMYAYKNRVWLPESDLALRDDSSEPMRSRFFSTLRGQAPHVVWTGMDQRVLASFPTQLVRRAPERLAGMSPKMPPGHPDHYYLEDRYFERPNVRRFQWNFPVLPNRLSYIPEEVSSKPDLLQSLFTRMTLGLSESHPFYETWLQRIFLDGFTNQGNLSEILFPYRSMDPAVRNFIKERRMVMAQEVHYRFKAMNPHPFSIYRQVSNRDFEPEDLMNLMLRRAEATAHLRKSHFRAASSQITLWESTPLQIRELAASPETAGFGNNYEHPKTIEAYKELFSHLPGEADYTLIENRVVSIDPNEQ